MSERNVSIVIPTYKRLYTIKETIDSYLDQEYVKEIIYVDDGGTDGLSEFISEYKQNEDTKGIDIIYVCHENNKGAAAARNTGVNHSSGYYVLFGEDDAYLGTSYVKCLRSMLENSQYEDDIVSGQIIMLKEKETTEEALQKYLESETSIDDVFEPSTMTLRLGLKLKKGMVSVPFTHALFMTKRSKLSSIKFDEYYFPGNGYREETDLQMNSYCQGHNAYIIDQVQCFHMARSAVKVGGQRKKRLVQYLYCIKYNYHFYEKYFSKFYL
ncbi:glycosyltransferase family 2 protein, partial [Vibrio harveyi]|nr:glycosyltransferase family 2 protein [Vibrio harveyi]